MGEGCFQAGNRAGAMFLAVPHGRSVVIYYPQCGLRNEKPIPSDSGCTMPGCSQRFSVTRSAIEERSDV